MPSRRTLGSNPACRTKNPNQSVMHDALKEKLKWRLGERLEEEGKEEAVEVVEDELDHVFD